VGPIFFNTGSSGAGQPAYSDVTHEVNKFKRFPPPDTPIKADAMLHSNVPQVYGKVGFLDIGNVVEGYQGKAYWPYGPCSVPSTVDCGTQDCGFCAIATGDSCMENEDCEGQGDYCVKCGAGEICSRDAYGQGDLRCRDHCKRCAAGS
jgi:hypothetical protein